MPTAESIKSIVKSITVKMAYYTKPTRSKYWWKFCKKPLSCALFSLHSKFHFVSEKENWECRVCVGRAVFQNSESARDIIFNNFFSLLMFESVCVCVWVVPFKKSFELFDASYTWKRSVSTIDGSHAVGWLISGRSVWTACKWKRHWYCFPAFPTRNIREKCVNLLSYQKPICKIDFHVVPVVEMVFIDWCRCRCWLIETRNTVDAIVTNPNLHLMHLYIWCTRARL